MFAMTKAMPELFRLRGLCVSVVKFFSLPLVTWNDSVSTQPGKETLEHLLRIGAIPKPARRALIVLVIL
jgi:hypothetical protein